MKRPLIFITNDDGVNAPGIRVLIDAMKELGDIIVVAPDKPMSGMSHALTVSTILRLRKIVEYDGYAEYSCSGTPVDCLKLARYKILTRKADLVVSGINHGSNSSINVIYSGTMAAAIEGAIQGTPAIGFSLLDHSSDADFTAAAKYAKLIAAQVLEKGLPKHTCLNVNVPKAKVEDLKGFKVCRQAMADWDDEYIERIDPVGHSYFWLTGEFENDDLGEDTDEWALKNNYVSVVPVQTDYTNHDAISQIRQFVNEK